MPSQGEYQKAAGVDVSDKCVGPNDGPKTMIAGKVFKIVPQEYKGNPVFKAQGGDGGH